MIETTRLLEAIREGANRTEERRKRRRSLLEEKNAPSRPLNAVDLAVSIWRRHVIARTPAVAFTTRDDGLVPLASDWSAIVNAAMRHQAVGLQIERAVVDALFALGCCKVGLDGDGRPRVAAVDFDDLLIDPDARNQDEITWIADRYWLPIDQARERWPGIEPGTRATTSKNGMPLFTEAVMDGVTIMDVFVPDDGILLRFRCDDAGLPTGNPIEEKLKWEYGENRLGPYRLVTFDHNAGSIHGLSPVQSIDRLHRHMNDIFEKVARQATRQKSIGVANRGSDDAEAVMSASDGEIVALQDSNAVKEVRYGGPDQQSLGFLGMLQRLLSYFGGNLDALGGLGTRSSTVGQEQLLVTSASMRIAEYQAIATEFVGCVMRDFSWWLWTHPTSTYAATRPIEGLDFSVKAVVTPEMRTQRVYDRLDLEVAPYSMQSRTPAERLQSILGFVVNVGLPLLPHFERIGFTIDPEEIRNLVAEYSNMPEMRRIFRRSSQEELNIAATSAPANSGTPTGAENGPQEPPHPETQPAGTPGAQGNPNADLLLPTS